MNRSLATILSLLVAAVVASVVLFWLRSDYRVERDANKRMLVERGEAVLTAVEGGVRSHRRMGMWFSENIQSTLDSVAAGPGLRALALFSLEGKELTAGGAMPDGVKPSLKPQWLADGLLVCNEVRFYLDQPPPEEGPMSRMEGREPPPGPPPDWPNDRPNDRADDRPDDWSKAPAERSPMERRDEPSTDSLTERPRNDRATTWPRGPFMGSGRGPRGFGGPGGPMGPMGPGPGNFAVPDYAEDLLKGPVYLAALLDDSSYRQAVGASQTRFVVSALITLTAVLMGLALVALIQRHGRLAAELGTAREREKRLEELTRLGAGLAHETKNPLTVIRGLAQQWLSRAPDDSETRARAQRIIDEADRVVGRVNSFLTYSRPPLPKTEAVELDKLLGDMAGVFRDEAAAKGVSLRVESRPARVLADPDMLRQVLANLLANALQACRENDSIELAAAPEARGRLSLTVRDTGEGIAPADLSLVAKPYFTRRPGGTGLGLAIVEQIAQAHGWRLEIESAAGQGTTARIAGMQEREKAE